MRAPDPATRSAACSAYALTEQANRDVTSDVGTSQSHRSGRQPVLTCTWS